MNQELYIIRLPDYSVPAMVSGGSKEYVGTKEEINKVIQEDEVIIAQEGTILFETTYQYFATEHTFINAFGFDHTIKTDEIDASILYFFDGKKYMRCIKARMKNLEIGVNGQDYYKPESFMGHPNILYIENDWICSTVYIVERFFKNKQTCLSDINHISPINYDCFFSDIFGDG